MRNSMQKTAVSIIGGFLGVGKTTAIRHLLQNKPENERWALLINEFGEVGIDGAALEDQKEGVLVKELPGGCICCAGSGMFEVAVATLLRKFRPDRLIIEPTGLAEPQSLVDSLRGPGFREAVDLRAVIALVHPMHFLSPKHREHRLFRLQLEVSDVWVANQCDLASAEALKIFRERANEAWPPRMNVVETRMGALDLALLDLKASNEAPSRRVGARAHDHSHAHEHTHTRNHSHTHARDKDRARVHQSKGVHTCGWVFPPEQIFDQEALRAWMHKIEASLEGLLRLKAVVHLPQGWFLLNWHHRETTLAPVAYRRDSRIELIVDASCRVDWEALEQSLRECFA